MKNYTKLFRVFYDSFIFHVSRFSFSLSAVILVRARLLRSRETANRFEDLCVIVRVAQINLVQSFSLRVVSFLFFYFCFRSAYFQWLNPGHFDSFYFRLLTNPALLSGDANERILWWIDIFGCIKIPLVVDTNPNNIPQKLCERKKCFFFLLSNGENRHIRNKIRQSDGGAKRWKKIRISNNWCLFANIFRCCCCCLFLKWNGTDWSFYLASIE